MEETQTFETTALTRQLGVLVSKAARNGTNAAARNVAKLGFIDAIATMFAGRREPAVVALSTTMQPLPSGGSMEVESFTNIQADQAALLNGVAAHALDFDDVALRGHPSAVMMPAILAAAQSLNSSGEQMLDAYVIGYEVWANLVDREAGMHHMKGWHPTGVFGAIGAAAACAALHRLDSTACAHALGLGATQSAGLMANFGSMAKPLQAGRAAQAGIWAAKWAAHGFTAGADVLEHDQGFLAAISPAGQIDRVTPVRSSSAEWSVVERGLSVKKYPTCFFTHRALDALLALLSESPVAAIEVERVDVTLSREHATVLRNHRPLTGLQAKFSIEFAMACALVRGKVGLGELTDAVVGDPLIQQCLPCVHVTYSTEYDPAWQGAAITDQVALTLRSGRRLFSQSVRQASGHAQRPLGQLELRTKFIDCLTYGNTAELATPLFDRLCSLEEHRAVEIFNL